MLKRFNISAFGYPDIFLGPESISPRPFSFLAVKRGPAIRWFSPCKASLNLRSFFAFTVGRRYGFVDVVVELVVAYTRQPLIIEGIQCLQQHYRSRHLELFHAMRHLP